MVELWKTLVKKILEIIPVICIALLSMSVVMLVVSLDPGVKWSEYNQELYYGSGIFGYYFNTLWSSLDVAKFAGLKDPHHPCTGKYIDLLKPLHDESWKLPIRSALHEAIGLVSATLFLLMVSVITNEVIKLKLFKIVTNITALGTGTIAVYYSYKAIGEYRRGIPEAISEKARSLYDLANRYYFPEKEEMQVGYNLAKYSAVTTILGCAFILGYICLYIPFGEGKWIWQKKSTVIPDT
ncbi:uncharacterized protein LOC143055636 [Mytilus galloprovincialis]|uniref:uncharacterized protein LOC143055636 n=1 Tax=Mytilus galloprovincialis TaxID=29158 RepID=UPI003F7C83B2